METFAIGDFMSLYCEIKTEFKNQEALIFALMETGRWQTDQIETYDDAVGLYGYHNDLRPEKANIIIRRKNIGPSSNDIGFQRNEDGTFKVIISEFDKSRYNQSWIDKLKSNYAFHAIRIQQESKGRSVTRTKLPNNNIRVEIKGYR
jgi:hypothetical protein